MPLELVNLSYCYPAAPKKTPALRQINAYIADGEFVGIMGRNGCGKSTLIQLIAGLRTPLEGTVRLDGRDINAKSYDRTELRSKVSLVFQNPEYQLFETTVERDVAFGLKHSGFTRTEITERVRWALETMGFSYEALRHQSPLALSGGEKRRVAIAGALVTRPKIIIFDEPIAGLDPPSRVTFLQMLDKLHQAGHTVIMVSHNTDALAEHAKRLLVLEDGALLMDDSIARVFADYDFLRTHHLGVSTPRALAEMLYRRGFLPVPDVGDAHPFSYSALLDAIQTRLQGGDAV